LNAQNTWQLLAYVILPYVALAVFVCGHIWRYHFDQLGWTSRSSQLYERRWLLLGSPLFHYGALAAIGGHVLGLLVPASWTAAVGITQADYEIISKVAGTSAVAFCVAGLVILTVRRAAGDRVRLATDRMDVVALGLLWAMIVLGFVETVVYNVLGPGYNYRPTVSVWLRGIFTLHPNVADVAHAPMVFQAHAIVAWFFLALFPFTRFVHFWSAPVGYLTRPFIVYRRRRTAAILSPGESAGWQTAGRSAHRR
jgi:nitrate reductase gamma subunit